MSQSSINPWYGDLVGPRTLSVNGNPHVVPRALWNLIPGGVSSITVQDDPVNGRTNITFAMMTGVGEVDSPAAISANQAALALSPTARLVRLATNNTTQRSIDGIVAQPGRLVEVFNVGPGALFFTAESGSAADPSYRIASTGSAIPVLAPGHGATLWYDDAISRWRLSLDMMAIAASGGITRDSDNALLVANPSPVRGQEAVSTDFWPSTQAQGTLNNGLAQSFDVATAIGRRNKMTAHVWVENGSGVYVYTKELIVYAHQVGGAAVVPHTVAVAENGPAGWTFVASANAANVRFVLQNLTASPGTYGLTIRNDTVDKP